MQIKNNKTVPRIKMLIAMVMSFAVVKLLSPVVFIADSPQINPHWAADLFSLPARSIAFIQDPTNPDNNLKKVELGHSAKPPDALEYKPVMKGVYAAEDPTTGKKYAKIEAGTKLRAEEVKLSDGRTVQIYVPVQ